jgi:NAD(P)-dependent dehydrogenase (short-subunit alcohol dehydrogenase family)
MININTLEKQVVAPVTGRPLDGRVLVVTGGGGAIGSEVARLAARAGACVVVNDIGAQMDGSGADAQPAQRVVDAIQAEGGRAIASHDSVATAKGASQIVEAALDSFGRIDSIVNNAGIARNRIFHQMSEEEWNSVLQVHLHGSFHMSRAAAPHFRAQAFGSFVHMTSTGGMIGNIGQTNYMAAKMALVALSKGIALDMRRFNVRSNCVSPLAKSRLTGLIAASGAEADKRLSTFERMPASMVAPLVIYLASELAADVTGQVFVSRAGEVFLMSQPRPLRSVHREGGWSVDSLAAHAMPALRSSFVPLDLSEDVFCWDPVQ